MCARLGRVDRTRSYRYAPVPHGGITGLDHLLQVQIDDRGVQRAALDVWIRLFGEYDQ